MFIKVENQLMDIINIRIAKALNTSWEQNLWYRNSLGHKNVFFFEDSVGKKIGYIIWANLNDESIQRIALRGELPKYYYEWNEGNKKLFLDMAIIKHRDSFKSLRRFFGEFDEFYFMKKSVLLNRVRNKKVRISSSKINLSSV